MKQLLLLATLVFSRTSFVQYTIDFVLTNAYGKGDEKSLEFARFYPFKKGQIVFY